MRRWLAAGDFDVLHLHEPVTPSVGMLALWTRTAPSSRRSTPRSSGRGRCRSRTRCSGQSMDKISARIAVSEDARRTLVEHLGGDAVVIPNGVYVDAFALAEPDPRWTGHAGRRPRSRSSGASTSRARVCRCCSARVPDVLRTHPERPLPGRRPGRPGPDEARELLGGRRRGRSSSSARCPTRTRPRFLRSVDVYCAPQTGGESFGIVLVEAMSAGAAGASRATWGAFRRVLDDGTAGGVVPDG